MERIIIIHYHEIALKGKNREFFENMLVSNIKRSLSGESYGDVQRRFGRIVVFLKNDSNEDSIRKKIKKVFGIANFSFGFLSSIDLSVMQNDIWEKIKDKTPKTFRVTIQRSNKHFPKKSPEIAREVGGFLHDQFQGRVAVDLENPELNVFCEIGDKNSFFYIEKEKGYSGLPVFTAGKVVSLVSSGFDSPVASWKMARRGAEVIYVHFHSYPYTKKASYDNVKELVKVLKAYTISSKVYFVPFAEIQKEISFKAKSSYRVILYRRYMIRIAEMIAKKEGAKALVTGDSLSQVASQTLENMSVISEAATMPVLRPLVGENKEDTIDMAKEIGTYDISAQPYEDCCSLFMPDRPETRGKLEEVLNMEEELHLRELMDKAFNEAEVLEI